MQNFLNSISDEKGNKKNKKENNELLEIYNLWKKSHFVVLNRPCLLSDVDKSMLKKLLLIYGFNNLKMMIYYYWKNYRNLGFYKKVEIPKVRLLYWFRDDFFEKISKNSNF